MSLGKDKEFDISKPIQSIQGAAAVEHLGKRMLCLCQHSPTDHMTALPVVAKVSQAPQENGTQTLQKQTS